MLCDNIRNLFTHSSADDHLMTTWHRANAVMSICLCLCDTCSFLWGSGCVSSALPPHAVAPTSWVRGEVLGWRRPALRLPQQRPPPCSVLCALNLLVTGSGHTLRVPSGAPPFLLFGCHSCRLSGGSSKVPAHR